MLRFDSPVFGSNFFFFGQDYRDPTDLRFDIPDSIGGATIFDKQTDIRLPSEGGSLGAAMHHHLRNLGMY